MKFLINLQIFSLGVLAMWGFCVFINNPLDAPLMEAQTRVEELEIAHEEVCAAASSTAEVKIEKVTEYIDKIRYVNKEVCTDLEDMQNDLDYYKMIYGSCEADRDNLMKKNDDLKAVIKRMEANCINL